WARFLLESAAIGPLYERLTGEGQILKNAQSQLHAKWRDVDAPALIKWAEKIGHLLGHRTSLRLALLKSDMPIVKEVKALSINIPDKDANDAVSKLFDEVRGGDRPADERWFADFKQAVAPNMQLKIPCGPDGRCFDGIQVAARMSHLFSVLKSAQRDFLVLATSFARQVRRLGRAQRLKKGAPVPLLTRFELMEAAAQSPAPNHR